MMQTVARATLVVIAIVITALALWQMREAVQLLLIALAVSAGLNPAIGALRARGLRRERAIGAVVLLMLLALGLCVFGLSLRVLFELEQLLEALPIWYDQLRALFAAQADWAAQIAEELPSSTGLLGWLVDAEALSSLAMQIITSITVTVVLVVAAISLGFYWLVDQTRIERVWLSLFPLWARLRVRQVWIRSYQEVRLYVRGGSIVAVITAVLLAVVFLALDLPAPVTLALFGGVALIIPIIGPLFAVLPPVLAALTISPETALITGVLVIIITALIKSFLNPLLFRDGISVNPVLTLICIMALGEWGGLWLIFLGPPLAAALQTIVQVMRNEPNLTPTTSPLLTQPNQETLQKLHERLDRIASESAATPEAAQVNSLIERARRLVRAAAEAPERS